MSVSENSKDRTNGNGNDLEFADGDFIGGFYQKTTKQHEKYAFILKSGLNV